MASPFVDAVFENWNLIVGCAHVTDECAHYTVEKLVNRLATNSQSPKYHGGRVGEVSPLLEGYTHFESGQLKNRQTREPPRFFY